MFVETVEVDDQLEVCEFRSHDIGLVRGAGARTYFTLPYRDPCYHGQIRVPRARNSAQVTDYKPYVVCNFHQAVISTVLISSMCTIFNINLRASEKRKGNEENLLRIRNSKWRKSSEGKMDFIYDGNKYLIGKDFFVILSAICGRNDCFWDYYIFWFFWPPLWCM